MWFKMIQPFRKESVFYTASVILMHRKLLLYHNASISITHDRVLGKI
jgi:hypothetical protein